MSGETTVERAAFYRLGSNGDNGDKILDVHFNPVSLVYTVTNTLQQQSNTRRQYVSQSTAKLTMDLIFDTTSDGSDVRVHTSKIARLMEPGAEREQGQRDVPEVIAFDWGTFRFKGMVETYRETIDFFAPEGVPLRATVSLGLTRQDHVFTESSGRASSHTGQEQPIVAAGAGQDVNDIATAAGSPQSWQAIAAANGVENPRRPGVAALALGGSVQLSAGVSAGGSLGVSARASIGGSVGLSASATSLGAAGRVSGAIGGSTSAGITASGGAFGGLRSVVRAPALPVRVGAALMQQNSEPAGMSAVAGASIGVGGRASGGGSGSGSADVGAQASLRAVISFDD